MDPEGDCDIFKQVLILMLLVQTWNWSMASEGDCDDVDTVRAFHFFIVEKVDGPRRDCDKSVVARHQELDNE